MLQLFKKQGTVISRAGSSSTKQILNNKYTPNQMTSCDKDTLDESLARFHSGSTTNEHQSRLAMNLPEILGDKICLSYFVQFLDKKNALSSLKFYLDSENFKAAAYLIFQSRTGSKMKNNCDFCACVHGYSSNTLQDSQFILDGDSNNSSIGNHTESQLRSNCITGSRTSGDLQIDCNLQIFASLGNIEDEKMNGTSIKNICAKIPQDDCHFSETKSLTDDEKSRIRAENSKKNDYLQDFKVRSLKHKCSPIVVDKLIISDGVRIYKKYLVANSRYFIYIPPPILSNISLALSAQTEDMNTSMRIPSDCFEEAQTYVLRNLEKKYLSEFLESAFYCRYCISLLTNGSLSLQDILLSEAALFYFTEYLEQQGKRNYLEFWMAAMNFRKYYKSRGNGKLNKMEAKNDAMIVYNKYFSLQASFHFRISSSVRSRIQACICVDNEEIFSCFDLPIRIIEGFLNKNYFDCFLQSSLFQNYLRELQMKIYCNESLSQKYSINPDRQTTLSESTSNKPHLRRTSISQQNTLLAMETVEPHFKLQASSAIGTELHIDSKHLIDPDLLWQRDRISTSNVLAFGKVDSMGRYERNFEPSTIIEEKWSLSVGRSRLKNAVKKLVHLPEDRVQEEIAWQMAEMIVNDVTNVTLRNSKSTSS